MTNQNPEQIARDHIDKMLIASGWVIQGIKKINLYAGLGVAVKEYLTDVGPADYVLFVDGKPCGVIEAKREEEGHRISVHEICLTPFFGQLFEKNKVIKNSRSC
jgi:type I restriction enzyme R subunit